MMKLEISGLSFSYGERQVLEDISFGVAEGEFVSLLGPSGCGKSTVLKLLTGILSPDRGRILVDGEEIRGLSSHFAYMPQNDLLFPWKTILDNVCLYGRIHGSLEEMRERAREYFPVFGLEGYEDSYPASLSGGMRQRAALLRTYLCSEGAALLDEPFSALDALTKASIHRWYLEVMEQIELSTLFITHDIDEAILLSDRIYLLSGKPGHITAELNLHKESRPRGDFALTSQFLEYKKEILSLLQF